MTKRMTKKEMFAMVQAVVENATAEIYRNHAGKTGNFSGPAGCSLE